MLIPANVVFGGLVLALLLASLIDEPGIMGALGTRPAPEHSKLYLTMRLVMVVGICATPIVHFVLIRLRAIVDSVARSTPFSAENAVRLQQIAWAVLGLEVLHLVVDAVARVLPAESEPLNINWTFFTARLLTVLLLFVLARVFEHGVVMQADLEGTV